MSENRKLQRKIADVVLEISDHNMGTPLGHIVNITPEGFLLISNNSIAVNSVFQVDMSLPMAIDGNQQITFGAAALWSSPARQAGRHWTGFHIIDISPEASAIIEKMIEDWQVEP